MKTTSAIICVAERATGLHIVYIYMRVATELRAQPRKKKKYELLLKTAGLS